jgi:hypothetical protein
MSSALASYAAAWHMIVLPVPAGPYSMTFPLPARMPTFHRNVGIIQIKTEYEKESCLPEKIFTFV